MSTLLTYYPWFLFVLLIFVINTAAAPLNSTYSIGSVVERRGTHKSKVSKNSAKSSSAFPAWIGPSTKTLRLSSKDKKIFDAPLNAASFRLGELLGGGISGDVYGVEVYTGSNLPASSLAAKEFRASGISQASPETFPQAYAEAKVLKDINEFVGAGTKAEGQRSSLVLIMKKHNGKNLEKTSQYQAWKASSDQNGKAQFMNMMLDASCRKAAYMGIDFKRYNTDLNPANVVVEFKNEGSYDILSLSIVDWGSTVIVNDPATWVDIYNYCMATRKKRFMFPA